MDYETKLKAGKVADLATLAAHGINLPNSTDAVVACNAAKAVQAIAAQRDELAALLSGALDSQEANGYIGVQLVEEIRATLAKVRAS